MLSLPHLVVLFVVALVIFGPEKLPELARMLGKATTEFRRMTTDFRFALEDEVRELERQNRILKEEVAAAVIQPPPPAMTPPEGTVQRILAPTSTTSEQTGQDEAQQTPHTDADQPALQETVTAPHEKSSDDNVAV